MNERIKELRKAMGKSQEEFGKILGITKSGVSEIESGRRNVTERHIIMLKNSENVNEEWLRTGKGEMFLCISKSEQIADKISDVLKSDKNDFKRRLISALAELDEDGWNNLEHLIDSFSNAKKNQG